ncbi:MAG: trigger factor [Bdellovibrionaceae bacterium]|nr:trigger factor [Pseudobdellovibrionaceae bacterium]
MKSTVESLEGLERKLNIEVPQESVQNEFELAYKNIQRQASIPGFRKGKAPIKTIEKMYGDRVKQDVLQNLVQKAYESALNEHSLNPIGFPNIKFDEFESDQDFSFSAQFEVRPKIELKKYEGLKVQKERLEIEDDRIDAVIDNMLQSRAENVPVLEDRPAQNGDIAEIDFDGFIDGAPLPGGQGKNHPLELGTNSFIDGFEEGLVGAKPGEERELNLKFPEEYHSADIAGKNVTFKVKVNKLLKKSLPELNDEFVATLGAGVSTVAELRDLVKKDMEQSESQRIEDELKNRILKVLVENNPVDVPKSLHAEQKQRLIQNMAQRLQQQGMNEKDFAEYTQKWDGDFSDSASNMIQSSFLIDELAEKLEIRATEKDVNAKIQEYAAQSGIEPERLNEYYAEDDRKSQLRYKITEDKVVQHLLDKAEVQEVAKAVLADEKKS